MNASNFEPHMAEAIALAGRARWATWPNPTVGAVLVRDGKVVARGWHEKAGEPHAEIKCLQNAAENGVDPAPCTLVVTLEPCNHQGRTPPCTRAILDAGIREVVFGLADPNPQAAGGAAFLAENGVNVVGPVLEEQCRDLVADFMVWQKEERPYILLKMAATLDGRIATRTGLSQWITSGLSRARVHMTRSGVGSCGGAVLVGGGTFRSDNPALTARNVKEDAQQPLACVLTSRLPDADADFRLLRERPESTVFLSSPASAASTRAQALRDLGCRVFGIHFGQHDNAGLREMFRLLRQELGVPCVLCEGGGKLALSLLDAGLVDEFHLHLAPIILGDNEARPLFDGRSPLGLEDALHMRLCSHDICHGDLHLLLRPEE